MAIVFGSDAGIAQNSTETIWSGLKRQASDILSGIQSTINTLAGVQPVIQERVFVDSGFTNVPGTSFAGSLTTEVSDTQERNITSQEPVLTVYIRKRAFRALA